MARPMIEMMGLVLSTDPLITLSTRNPVAPLGVVSAERDVFAGRRSLNLVGLSWMANAHDIEGMIAEREALRREVPGAEFCVLANDSADLLRLTEAGFSTIVANANIFIDDDVFRPIEQPDGTAPIADAIYVAKLRPFKQHNLCAAIESLAFIYYQSDDRTENCEASVRKQFPHARYLNHEAGGGAFRLLSGAEIASYLNRAKVGLCLSSIEGQMRASMEYVLCGLPVVTVPSQGGRDRYLLPDYTITCDADPPSVARAARELAARKLSRRAIRERIEVILAFERHNFLKDLDMLVRRTHGVPWPFMGLAPIIKGNYWNRSSREIVEPLIRS